TVSGLRGTEGSGSATPRFRRAKGSAAVAQELHSPTRPLGPHGNGDGWHGAGKLWPLTPGRWRRRRKERCHVPFLRKANLEMSGRVPPAAALPAAVRAAGRPDGAEHVLCR